MSTLEPNQIVVMGEEFAIAFTDGRECFLPLPMLRRACPCATCQGEPDARGRVVKPHQDLSERAFDLVRWQLVGGYALQLFWGDGHSSGIYSFQYLRELAKL